MYIQISFITMNFFYDIVLILLQILNFTKPVNIESRQTLTAFLLKFHPNDTQLHFTTYLTLYTNASQFVIPIVVYNGLLQVSFLATFLFSIYLKDA